MSLFISLTAFSADKVELIFPEPAVKQGAIVSVQLKADSSAVQSVDFQKLKGQTVGKKIYFYSISPLLRKDSESTYEGQAKIIFVETPEDSQVTDTVQGRELQIKWNPLKVEPVEAQKSFLFADFDVPYPKSILAWILTGLGLLALVVGGWFGFNKYKKAKLIKENKIKIKSEIYSASSFDGVVSVWKKKRSYIQQFPHLEEPFEKLEGTLFKYQFKPYQSESEKEEVVKAYQSFLSSIQGGFNGI